MKNTNAYLPPFDVHTKNAITISDNRDISRECVKKFIITKGKQGGEIQQQPKKQKKKSQIYTKEL